MKNKKSENKRVTIEVDKTMSLLEEPQYIATDPFFYTRLKARIDSYDRALKAHKSFNTLLQPVFLLLLVAVNVFTLYYIFKQDSAAEAQQTFADEYNLALNDTELFDLAVQNQGGVVK